ncbi:terminase small subunit [Anaerosalibacter massiliensis]|uniref:Terminase small subunit n=1 Tax=Anaerosalibacter massiliensis TaxID=1347392 RepID=A0A9X2MQS0_9FIRM|nr:terminase small subunit [Anaerosalibacter massiliensis]MCR2045501.1 terminase small subunit [Anaerosalibacter massiliensis]
MHKFKVGGDMGVKLTVKQKKFCDYYIELGNATEAAIRAGYSKKTARQTGNENLTKPYIKSYIDEKMKEIEDKQIAKADEVLKYLTSIMRGEIAEETPILIGEGVQELVPKGTSVKDRIRAAELIGRRYSLFTDKQDIDIKVPKIIFDIPDDDENDKD